MSSAPACSSAPAPASPTAGRGILHVVRAGRRDRRLGHADARRDGRGAAPTSGSFSAYADRALGRWAGFSIGWLYWFFWVVVLAVEATAGAEHPRGLDPGGPAVGLGPDRDGGAHRHQPGLGRLLRRVRVLVRRHQGRRHRRLHRAGRPGRDFGVLPGSDYPAWVLRTSPTTAASCPTGPGAILTGVLMVVFSFMGARSSPSPPASPRTRAGRHKGHQQRDLADPALLPGLDLRRGGAAAVGHQPPTRCSRARTSLPWTRSASRTPADHERHRPDRRAVLSQLRPLHRLPYGLLARRGAATRPGVLHRDHPPRRPDVRRSSPGPVFGFVAVVFNYFFPERGLHVPDQLLGRHRALRLPSDRHL